MKIKSPVSAVYLAVPGFENSVRFPDIYQMLVTHFEPFPDLETPRLLLGKITPEDGPAILGLRSSESVMKYIDRERSRDLADAIKLIQRMNTALDSNESITWRISLRSNPAQLIGTIGYYNLLAEHFRAEVGYMLHPDHWKKGIMKEALRAAIDYGFNKMRLHSIAADINPENKASAALLLSTGFVKEASFKENFFFDGRFRDTEIYSLLQ